MPHIKEPTLGAPIETGVAANHMGDMRTKYQQGWLVFGGNSSSADNVVNAVTVHAPTHMEPCTYYVDACMKPATAFTAGMRSIDLFPSTRDVMKRIDSHGVRSDWAKIGGDFRRAVNMWATANDRREREGA